MKDIVLAFIAIIPTTATALSTIYLLPMSQGVVFATLSHEAQAVTMILFGGVSMVYEMVRRRKINVK